MTMPRSVLAALSSAAALGLASLAAAQGPPPPPPPAPLPAAPNFPAGNPFSEAKRILGKALYFDEQLSASNTVACATCHQMRQSGTDPRRAPAAGADGVLGTTDDVFASPGVVRSDSFNKYLRDGVYALTPQSTGRASPSAVDAAFAAQLFWDGRATGTFTDPVTGQVVLPAGAALESQSVNPPVSGAEMGHDQIDWVKVTTKLAKARPLALATDLTTDLAAALQNHPTYGDLFTAAFGDAQVTAARVAMAIATYERTLIANQTPWDRFIAGDTTAMTQNQINGWNIFRGQAQCIVCHAPPLFSNTMAATGNIPNQFGPGSFRNIGLRSPNEDLGRFTQTGIVGDRGRFKVATLRNAALKTSFMHTGQFTNLGQVLGFYARAPGAPVQNPDNLDPVMNNITFPPNGVQAVQDFVASGLLDTRVRDGLAPFDAPTLYSQRAADRPSIIGGGVPGTGGAVPQIIASDPPLIGNADFRIGLDRALAGASATLVISSQPPSGGILITERSQGPMVVSGTGSNGYSTAFLPLSPKSYTPGQVFYAQWVIADPSAQGGLARSSVARVQVFCAGVGCAPACDADANEDLSVNLIDIFAFLHRWFAQDLKTDLNNDGAVNVPDIFAFLNAWFAGC